MLGFPPTALSLNTGPAIVAVLPPFLVSTLTTTPPPPLLILWGMNVRVITHSSCGEYICDVSAHPLAVAACHELPWKHLAAEASDSLSWLGVVKPVKWNRWESVAVTWSFCPCYFRNQDFIISWENHLRTVV